MPDTPQEPAIASQKTADASSSPPDGVDLTAYAGCWVAMIGDQIAGVGATAEEARLAARHSRPRERVNGPYLVSQRNSDAG